MSFVTDDTEKKVKVTDLYLLAQQNKGLRKLRKILNI
jgi:hypothetical protein